VLDWVVVAPIVLVAALVIAFVIASALSPVTPRDVAWISGDDVPPADEARVYARYLWRHRAHRVVGGVFGACVALVVVVRWSAPLGAQEVALGAASDPLLCTMSGVVIGALSAETFRLRQPRIAAASLRQRAALPRTGVAKAALVLVGSAFLLSLVLVVAGDGTTALGAAVIGGGTVLLGHATRRAIVGRARPVMSARAARVDAHMRAFAAESVAWLQLAAAVLTCSWVVSPLIADGLGTVAGLGCLVAVVVLLRRAKPRPARSWRPAVLG